MSKHLPMWHQTHLCIPVQSRYGPFEPHPSPFATSVVDLLLVDTSYPTMLGRGEEAGSSGCEQDGRDSTE